LSCYWGIQIIVYLYFGGRGEKGKRDAKRRFGNDPNGREGQSRSAPLGLVSGGGSKMETCSNWFYVERKGGLIVLARKEK